MRKLILILILSGFGLKMAKCQTDNYTTQHISTESSRKRGIYRSFEEFQQNLPSYTDSFYIRENPFSGKAELWDPNCEKDIPKIKGKIWGYSTGMEVFVKNKEYYRMLHFGAYCVYTVNKTKTHADLSIGDVNFEGSDYLYTATYIIEYSTGVSKKLKRSTLNKYILSKDPYLWELFENDERYPIPLIEYVVKYNEKHSH